MKDSLRHVWNVDEYLSYNYEEKKFDIKDTRKIINQKLNADWKSYGLFDESMTFDTILGLSGAKDFLPEHEYGVSGLGGACGYGDHA